MKKSHAFFFMLLLFAGCTTFNRVKSNRWLAKAAVEESVFFQKIPFELKQGFPVFQVKLGNNAQAFNFMFDSGGFTVLSEKAIQQTEGISSKSYIDLRDANKVTQRIDIFKLEKLQLGAASFKDVGFAKIGFTESEYFSCLGIDGTLGPNIMKEGIWHFDYSNKQIVFTNQLEKVPGIDQAIRVPITTNNIHKPWIEFTAKGFKRKAIVDTGANSSFLIPGAETETWQQSFAHIEKIAAKSSAGNSAMTTNASVFKVDSISFGDLEVAPLFTESGQFLQDYILGISILEQYNLTFDLAENALYFHPNPGASFKQELISFGFSFDFNTDQLSIGSMFTNGPAYKAGLRPGDMVSKINGQSYTFQDYCDFLNHFEIDKTSKLTLEIKRREKPLTFVLEKKKLL